MWDGIHRNNSKPLQRHMITYTCKSSVKKGTHKKLMFRLLIIYFTSNLSPYTMQIKSANEISNYISWKVENHILIKQLQHNFKYRDSEDLLLIRCLVWKFEIRDLLRWYMIFHTALVPYKTDCSFSQNESFHNNRPFTGMMIPMQQHYR